MTTSDGSTASYYELPEGATELQHLISHRDMNAQIGEVFRACYRYGQASHSDKLRDAKKIRFYAQAEIDRLEKHIERLEKCARGFANPYPDTVLDLDAAWTEGEERMRNIASSHGDGEHYAEDMTNPANWRAGDLVVRTGPTSSFYTAGKIYAILKGGDEIDMEDDTERKIHYWTPETARQEFRFHSRPSQVNEQEISGIWHHHDGGEMPCDEKSLVEIEYRSGQKTSGWAMNFSWGRLWSDCDFDIIRYRML